MDFGEFGNKLIIALIIIILWWLFKSDDKDTNNESKSESPHPIENKPVTNSSVSTSNDVAYNSGKYLYHFTDPVNIPSIKRYGLLSWQELLSRNIWHNPASDKLSRDLDQRYNLEDYVRLSLNQNHPMFSAALYYKRVDQLVWLKIKIDVVDDPNTLFSSDNAASNRAIINNNKFTALDSPSPQAEVLVKKRIDPKYIIFPY